MTGANSVSFSTFSVSSFSTPCMKEPKAENDMHDMYFLGHLHCSFDVEVCCVFVSM